MSSERTWLLWIVVSLTVSVAINAAFGAYGSRLGPPRMQSSPPAEPYVLTSTGDTTWLQVHTDSSRCPGDPRGGHGGEATGGPGPLETWCFEGGPGDTCGTNPPWDTKCLSHFDRFASPSDLGVNYWHVDTYRADQRDYCGDYALWCGSDSGCWAGAPPGYARSWRCNVELRLPGSFGVANGCTLLFDPRYDMECKYDYLYLDFWDGAAWVTLATFNATSNNPGPECGYPTGGNPDYFGNTDLDRLVNCDWQERVDPSEPAFKEAIPPDSLKVTSGPRFRWRFIEDGGVCDQDGGIDTDGAAFIDNIWVWGDSERFVEDFETGLLDTALWSLPNPAGVIDQWHIVYDPDPPYEGGDGGSRVTCLLDSSFVFRGRPEGGYPGGATWRNGWWYRLMTPPIAMQNSGCVVQWDEYWSKAVNTCDSPAIWWWFYDPERQIWCEREGYVYQSKFGSGGYHWNFNLEVDISPHIFGLTADSVRFAWDFMDHSTPDEGCRGRHRDSEFIVDNISIGFFDAYSTRFSARPVDLLQDTFFQGICGYNAMFEAWNTDTVTYYWGPLAPPLPSTSQFCLDVIDADSLSAIELFGSVDKGETWLSNSMMPGDRWDPDRPSLGGTYYGTLSPIDFGDTCWAVGTEIWYYVRATDGAASEAYFPRQADPLCPHHTGGTADYLSFSILPMYPGTYTGPRILLVDGFGRHANNWAPCLGRLDKAAQLEDIYGSTLADAGYCYDTFTMGASGTNAHLHPIAFGSYEAVVWSTGPNQAVRLLDHDTQSAIRDYLGGGGKIILCGDRLAYFMAPVFEGGAGGDSLSGDFLGGILGAVYVEEMPAGFVYPYIYTAGVDCVYVLGSPAEVGLDTLLVYRECPELKDMSYVLANPTPPSGYTVQPLMSVCNPTIGEADEIIYTEYNGVGQCVFVDFDLSGCINHAAQYCSGDTPVPAPMFQSGTYCGRVELVRTILEDLFGLPGTGGGTSHVPDSPVRHKWALGQNTPNPFRSWTDIGFELPHRCDVRLDIYNALGQHIRTLVDQVRGPGTQSVRWDRTNSKGEVVSSGVYFYTIKAAGFSRTKKMLLLK